VNFTLRRHIRRGVLYDCYHWNLFIFSLVIRIPKIIFLNPLVCRGNYSATSNNMKLVHWPLIDGLFHLVQRGGVWARLQPAQASPRCTKCNSSPINGQCTNHLMLYNCRLHCGFNVPVEILSCVLNPSFAFRWLDHHPEWKKTGIESEAFINKTSYCFIK